MSSLRQILLTVFFLLVAAAPLMAADSLRYAGATTLQRFFMPDAARLFRDETGLRIQIEGGNTGPGISALLKGEVDMAGAGRYLTTEEKRLGLAEHFLGWDVLTIVVHKSNPVENLTIDQLQGIFSGAITNWKETGGWDKSIMVVTSPKGSGMRTAVQTLVLKGQPYLKREIISTIVAEADQQVSLFRTGITALSYSMIDAKNIKAIKVNGVIPDAATIAKGDYPLAKPLTLVTRGTPQGDLARFLELVKSPRGEAILNRKFVALD
ncbi:MAG: phosphate ABC transporter substrate-binding protein [Desulfuromonadales bacterium]|nr:phosphate ABC transporter substrate-binding protein [Desulfuromonadales bacterium]